MNFLKNITFTTFKRTPWPFTALSLFALAANTLHSAEDIRPLRGAISPPWWQSPTAWILIGAGCILTAIIVMLVLRKSKKPAQKVATPYEVAIGKLKEARTLMEQKEDKAFSSVVSDAIRQYIEKSYHIAAPEQTTEEFLAAASSHAWLKGEPLDQLSAFLELCDVVKFAQQSFGDDQREAQYESAKKFLENAEQSLKRPNNPQTSASREAKTPATVSHR